MRMALLGSIPWPFVVASLTSMVLTLTLVATLRWHGRLSLDECVGVQKCHHQAVPRVGGIAVVAASLAVYVADGSPGQSLLGQVLIAGAPAFAAGLTEDLTKRVSAHARFLASMSCAVLAFSISGYSITRLDVPGIDWLLGLPMLSVVFTAFAVAGVINAVNIIDGMNGLASITALVIFSTFALLGSAHGDPVLVQTCWILGGATFGFVLFNWPLGKIFLGDGGAYFLGFGIAWLAVLLPARHPEVSAWASLLICGFPILEVLFSMQRRWRCKRPIDAPDNLHLHSLIKRRLVRGLLPNSSQLVRNSVTGAIMGCSGLLPAWVALHWSHDTLILMSSFALCAVLYATVYARLTQFRWRFLSSHAKVLAKSGLPVESKVL